MRKLALSVTNPISYLICMGIKTVENRTWTTDYRGRVYIHSCGDFSYPMITKDSYSEKFTQKLNELNKLNEIQDINDIDEVERKLNELNLLDDYKEVIDCSKKLNDYYDKLYKHYKIDILDESLEYSKIKNNINKYGYFHKNFSIIGYADLVDVVKDSKSIWAEEGKYHFIFNNPVLFDLPLINVKGKLRLFDISHIL